MVDVTALQLKQCEPLTFTDTSLTDVAPHVLALLLPGKSPGVELMQCAPTCKTLMDPPCTFAPFNECFELLRALQLKQFELLTRTDTPFADVAPHALLLPPLAAMFLLKAYAPTYNTLIDPPYEWAPNVLKFPEEVCDALELVEFTLRTLTCTLLTSVAPHMLLLLLSA
jgi:hypothetical protein